jgi:hypothetical protein
MNERSPRVLSALLILGVLLLVACDDTPTPPPQAPERAVQGQARGESAAEGVVDAPSRTKTATYELALATIEGAAESEQAFEVSLAGVGDWHVNTEYPIAVTVAADEGLAIAKPKLDRDDAAELSDDVARFVFVARATGPAAEGRVNAHVKFAMCTPSSCTFHDETVGLALRAD